MKRFLCAFLSLMLAAVALAGCARVSAGSAPEAEQAASADENLPKAETAAPEAEKETPVIAGEFELQFSKVYVDAVQGTEYTAGEDYIFGAVHIENPADYGIAGKDDAELRFADGTGIQPTFSSMSTQADGTVDYYTLVFAAKLDIYESAEYLLLDGKLYTVKITVL